MVVEDLLNLQQLGRAIASPDGKWLAVVISRAATHSETYRRLPVPGDVGRADIWVASVSGGKPRNITNGLGDGSGYWNPVWSPDGKRIAMLSTRGGGNVRPYVWEAASSTLRRLTDRSADLAAWGYDGFPEYAMIWSDDTTVLCPVTSENERGATSDLTKSRAFGKALKGWNAASAGMEPTVSVLTSGAVQPMTERPSGALLAINVISGVTRVVGTGNFRRLLVSPTGKDLALIAETGRLQPRGDRLLPYEENAYDLRRARLGLLSLSTSARIVWVDSVVEPKIPALGVPHSWSADGRLLAVVARRTDARAVGDKVFLVSAGTGVPHEVLEPGWPISATAWSSGGQLLALASGMSIDRTSRQSPLGWWVVPRTTREQATQVSAGIPETPAEILPTKRRDTMFCLAAGELWSLNLRSGLSINLTGNIAPLKRLVLPAEVGRSGRGVSVLLVVTNENDVYRVQLDGNGIHTAELLRPSRTAIPVDFHPEQGLIVFSSIDPTGSFLWSSSHGDFSLVLSLNEHVRGIADAKRLLIEYQGADGDSLKALLVLPIGYRSGQRYPLVTWVYPAVRITDTLYGGLEKQLVSWANLNLIPAHGYALLIPSVPVELSGPTTDLYVDLPKGVMSAIEKTITVGVADPHRLGIIGHSAGGYAVNVLVTYTNRFRAAVTVAGFSDLLSQYGVFVAASRYDDDAHEDLFHAAWLESGLGWQMGGPPWQQLWRYLRNSPYFLVDRIQTPLMMVQGDMDHVPLQQGEELFTALYRLGKCASFARYWGEGHDVSSPANIRDLWQRVFAWFDDYLGHDGSYGHDEVVAGASEPFN
jgi:dipeptidyl aminopeptidase/acylaminoacyl peptidase